MHAHYDFTIKQVGMNGQVSLGKEYAGKQIQISKLEDGTLIIKPGKFIPDSEMWLYNQTNIQALNEAIDWAENHPRHDNYDEIVSKIEND
ncbi:hypothetical protein NOVO_02045 [Rickettsiales bacterium Ac37b]|nr:hypothetical protein NOVO_02045 [Rickettsiales bacterium Ac37b]